MNTEHNHEKPPIAKGLRRARTISITKGALFFTWGIISGNTGLAMTSGHDLGDAWALNDEAKASETNNMKQRAQLMRRAGNKILFFTMVSGFAEITAGSLLDIGHADTSGALGSGLSTGFDVWARHGVLNDENHSHTGVGHTHVNLDVLTSTVNTLGSSLSVGTGNHIYSMLGAVGVAAITSYGWLKIRRTADEVEAIAQL